MEQIKNKFDKIKEESNKLKKEVRERAIGYILTALGLVAGLAWNEAIKSLIEQIFPFGKNSLWIKFAYAGLLTVAIVTLSVYLLKFLKKDGDSK
jgi:septation ring formation regulator EzrA